MVGKSKGVRYLVVLNNYPRNPSMQKDQKVQRLLSSITSDICSDIKSSASYHILPDGPQSISLAKSLTTCPPQLSTPASLYTCRADLMLFLLVLCLYLPYCLLLIMSCHLKSPFCLPFKNCLFWLHLMACGILVPQLGIERRPCQ